MEWLGNYGADKLTINSYYIQLPTKLNQETSCIYANKPAYAYAAYSLNS